MKKYFGWMFVLIASMTAVSAFAEDEAQFDDQQEEPLAVVLDDEDSDNE
jgi:hypothetical protein